MKKKTNFNLHYGDLTDSTNLIRLVSEIKPDEIYNLAAQSHGMVSFETPEYTANADALGTLRILEAIKILGLEKKNQILSSLNFRIIRIRLRNLMKKHLFHRKVHMQSQNSIHTG